MNTKNNSKTFDCRRADFTPYGFVCEQWFPARTPRPDRHNEIEINVTGSASLTYIMAGHKVVIGSRQLAIFWAATPHQIVDCSGSEPYFVATIPLSWFLQWKLPEHFVQLIMAGKIVCESIEKRQEADNLMFLQWVDDFSAKSTESLKTVQLEMEARLRRLAYAYKGTSAAEALKGHGRDDIDKVEKIAAYVATRYTGPVRLADIAREIGLNPNYTCSLFQKTFGTTLNAFITGHRISHAQRLLITSDAKVLTIALASGFNTLSRFNAAFREYCGCTPGEYRKRHLVAGKKSALPAVSDNQR